MNPVSRKTHLEFYREHQISPVRYDLSNLDAHMERRCSLYIKLGLPPLAFSNSSILEVAAGTGQNSLYIAQTKPSKLVLLEPNPTGVDQINKIYQTFNIPHTSPHIISETLENYDRKDHFDIVICENWLGTSTHEQSLLMKLANMVATHGFFVLTTVSPVGFVPNLLRRFLSIYLAPDNLHFQKRTEILIDAFASHIETLPAMTRNISDWVQDNMLNPAYFGLCLSIPAVIQMLGGQFDVIGTSPSFAEDWRWFKSLHGSHRKYNEHFLSEYWKRSNNFLDQREQSLEGITENNIQLEEKAIHLVKVIAAHEDAHLRSENVGEFAHKVAMALDEFIEYAPLNFSAALAGLNEIRKLINSPDSINIKNVSKLENFSALFGRETVYLSLMRTEL